MIPTNYPNYRVKISLNRYSCPKYNIIGHILFVAQLAFRPTLDTANWNMYNIIAVYYFMRSTPPIYIFQKECLLLMLVTQKVVHRLHRIKGGQRHLYEDSVPIAHGTIPQTGQFKSLKRTATF